MLVGQVPLQHHDSSRCLRTYEAQKRLPLHGKAIPKNLLNRLLQRRRKPRDERRGL